MKKIVYILGFCLGISSFTSCDTNDMFNKEQYKKVIYLLSKDDLTYPIEHNLDEKETTGYVTVYVAGSTPIDKDVTITLEYDDKLLNEYNLSNYDLETAKYAKELEKKRYTIENYTVRKTVGSDLPYVLLPIKIQVNGLSPDSAYMIPLKIKEVSGYEINLSKSRVLYHIYLKNDFAEQLNPRYLFMNGTRKIGTNVETKIAGNKLILPLSKNKVRVCAGIEYADRPTLEQINKKSIVLEIGEKQMTGVKGSYRPITITPYKSEFLQVEPLPRIDNKIELSAQEANSYILVNNTKRFMLSYRYRTIKTEATETTSAEWNDWIIISENMKHSQK